MNKVWKCLCIIWHTQLKIKDTQTGGVLLMPLIFRYDRIYSQWWKDLFRCRIDLLNFLMGVNIVAPNTCNMEFLHMNWYIAECFVYVHSQYNYYSCYLIGWLLLSMDSDLILVKTRKKKNMSSLILSRQPSQHGWVLSIMFKLLLYV